MEIIQRNKMISFLRVIAMLAIILLHIFSYVGIYEYGVLNIFTYVFLIISGYLYSSKKIVSKKEFIINRIKKILVPLWIWSLFLSIVTAIKGQLKLAITSFVISLFNLNGLDYFFFGHHILDNYQIEGLYHCWFITLIFVCYIILAYIKESKIEKIILKHKNIAFVLSFFIQIVFSLIFNVQIGGIITFFIGYFYLKNKEIKRIDIVKLLIACILLTSIRVLTHKIIDGTVFYDYIIQVYFNMIIGLFIFAFLMYIYQNNNNINNIIYKITNTKICIMLEKNSYYLYIVHYAFLKKPFDLSIFMDSKILQVGLFFVLSLISAKIINYFCNLIFVKKINN